MQKKITIGITQSEARFENYRAWISGADPDIELITLSAEKQNTDDVKRCNGILLSGGIDVTPAFYNSQRTRYPHMPKKGWNRERDLFEMKVFQLAGENGLPVLAICRGMQLVNVFLGGSLVPDLEEAGKQDHKRHKETDAVHTVQIKTDTQLAEVIKTNTGEVNSAHHQAVDEVSNLLKVNCLSADGVIEGVEWKDPSDKPPLLCVQWHPERMDDKKNNPLSENLRNWFLSEAAK